MRPPPVLLGASLLAFAGALPLAAEELVVRLAGDRVKLTASALRFLTGKPLERVRNGTAVPFDFQVSILGEGRVSVLRRSFERFVISYDIWEEKYSVSRLRSTKSSVSQLTSSAAEAWCMQNLDIPIDGLPADRELWIRLEVRAQQPKERDPVFNDPGVSLAALIDLFSRAGRERQQDYWRLEAGPVKLNDLRRAAAARGGA